MGKNIDKGLDNRIETQRSNSSNSKSSKTDKIKIDTSKKLYDNLRKK
jgi:hypothetical protein